MNRQILTRLLAYSLKAIWFFGPSVVTLVLSYYLFTGIDAGRDVIIIAAETRTSLALTIFCVLLWSFFLWYSSRLLAYEKLYNDRQWPQPVLTHFPRLVAYNAFVTIQAAVLSLPLFLGISFWYTLFFIILHNIYYFFLDSIFDARRNRRKRTIETLLLGIFYMGLLFYCALRNDTAVLIKWNLFFLVFGLFIVQIVFLRYSILRIKTSRSFSISEDPCERPVDRYEDLGLFGFHMVHVPQTVVDQEKIIFRFFNLVAFAGVCLFSLSFSSIAFAKTMGPMAVALIAFGILAGGFNAINMISLRVRFNVFVLMCLFAWLSDAIFPDQYRVQLTKSPAKDFYAHHRQTYSHYFDTWVRTRADAIKASTTYPVYIILSDGGASRSGYWVASVLGSWEDKSLAENSADSFGSHLFCLSGASGGTVGNATFYALLKYNDSHDTYRARARAFLKNDFLSYTMAHYMGPDLLRHLVKIPFENRADALAHTFAQYSEDSLYNAFDKNVSELVDTTGRLPIFFFNVTSVRKGQPAVVSSIRLEGFSERIDILSKVDSTGARQKELGDLTYGTATILSARFPYVSPAGKILNDYYVDGGYFDNSGSGIVQELILGIQSIIKNERDSANAALYQKLRFKVIHISNTPKSKPSEKINPFVNDLAAPLLTVFSTYSSQTEVNDKRLTNIMKQLPQFDPDVKEINLYRNNDINAALKEDYPMNWVISQYQRHQMDLRLRAVQPVIDSIRFSR